jgi:hypothetical protein
MIVSTVDVCEGFRGGEVLERIKSSPLHVVLNIGNRILF